MARAECKNCGNDNGGGTVYVCRNCGQVFCVISVFQTIPAAIVMKLEM
jgi:hypothetical protein